MARKIKYFPNGGDKIGFCIYVSESESVMTRGRLLRASIFKCHYCGKEFKALFSRVKNGDAKSCGCYKKTPAFFHSTTHGMSKSREYTIWISMKDRCYNPKCKRFKDYGGRGITICKRWLDSFETFFADMGKRPSDNHSIERNENSGNYEPSNCKWATDLEQANNKRNNRLITFKGKTLSIAQWSREEKIPLGRLDSRIRLNWSMEHCLYPKKFKTGQINHEQQTL